MDKTVAFLSLLFCAIAVSSASISDTKDSEQNRPSRFHDSSSTLLKKTFSRAPSVINTTADNDTPNPPLCWDPRLANFITSGLQLYSHDMGSMCKYVLDQIQTARYPGKWVVHGQNVASTTQGRDWQTLTNGDIYSGKNPNACFLRDDYYYVIVLKLY